MSHNAAYTADKNIGKNPVQWRSEGVFLVFWKTPLKMSLKNLLKIIYVAI